MTQWTWHRGLASGRYYVDNGDKPICDVANIEDAESTAHLIAAAPEMLESLRDILQSVMPYHKSWRIWDRVRTVVAKAKGEAA